MLLLIELGLVVAAAIAALVFPRLGSRWFEPIERRFASLARRPGLSVAIVGGTALALRVALLPILPIPEPAAHDEFSYLLAADTFAHGRLTNPTHPMWIHFETFHVNQKPTYMSMYYPAQGLFLAAGQVLLGHPFWGVWLSTGLMCAAICWMLQGWLPPLWSLIGGLLAVIRLGTFSYWANSYWGGAVAAIGGALVLGALPRIKRYQRVQDAVLMGVGFAILANSRPYEGLFFSVPVILALIIWMRSSKAPRLSYLVPRIIVPLALLLAITAAGMGYYFWRVTGNPFCTPFSVNVATYNPVPYFPWQAVRSLPAYHHPVMQNFYLGWWMRQYELGRWHPIILLLVKASVFAAFFLGTLLLFPVFALSFVLPYGISFRHFGRRTQFLLVVCSSVMLGALPPVYFNPHYAAPITCAIYALILIAMQRMRRWKRRGRPIGVAMVQAIPLIAVSMLLLRAAAPASRINDNSRLATWYAPAIFNTYRAGFISHLSQTPGLHLVIVRYRPEHAPANEWVYNRADIDDAKVVWARDMDAKQNSELICYFRDREVWLVQPDELPPKLSLYPRSQMPSACPDVSAPHSLPASGVSVN